MGQPFPIQDDQLVEHLVPAPVSLGPLFHDIPAGQVEHFFQGLVAGEHALDLCQYFGQKVERLQCFFEFLVLLLLRCQITDRAMDVLTVIPVFYVCKDCPAGFKF